MALTLRPIGVLRTPWKTVAECPRNGRQPDPAPLCQVELDPAFECGMLCIESFSHLILLYWLGDNSQERLQFTPPFDDQPRGVFATRAPWRPNPIGFSVVSLEEASKSHRFSVRYLDCLDGTPLLDIKPYLPSTDSEPQASMGWLARHATR